MKTEYAPFEFEDDIPMPIRRGPGAPPKTDFYQWSAFTPGRSRFYPGKTKKQAQMAQSSWKKNRPECKKWYFHNEPETNTINGAEVPGIRVWRGEDKEPDAVIPAKAKGPVQRKNKEEPVDDPGKTDSVDVNLRKVMREFKLR